MIVDERISAELRSQAPHVDEQVAWDRIRSAVPVHRRSRVIRLAAIPAAAVGFLLVGFLLVPNLTSNLTPASDPRNPFQDTWVGMNDDGSIRTMTIEVLEGGTVQIEAYDDNASACSGTGHFEGEKVLRVATPMLICDDRTQPGFPGGPSLEEQLQNLTLIHDPRTDTLIGNSGSHWTREGANRNPEPTNVLSDTEMTELLNGFLVARVAGEGAQQYLNVPEEDIPLLYATSSGRPFERTEFEQVRGTRWPYGWTAFKVRLFAGDTVVEQLLFSPRRGRIGLEYQPHGFGTDIAPTTEDGQPVAEAFDYFDGEVTLHAAHPWIFHDHWAGGRLIPEGPDVRPTTDGGERNGWDTLMLMADPLGTGCQAGTGPADAEALAEGIRSDPNLEATAPVAVRAGGGEALMMDVVVAAGASICDFGILSPVIDRDSTIHESGYGPATGSATGDLMRLYLFDAPEGSTVRILAVAIIAPEASFERAVEAAALVVDSVEFRTR
jgi:hypothetical protein